MAPDVKSVPLFWLLMLAAAVLSTLVLSLAVRRWYGRWSRRQKWARAMAAEADAPAFLEKYGYSLLGAQVPGSYCLDVDGQPMVINLRADYIVGREGKTYLAEVKSGRAAPKLNHPATRRQLLEYRVAFDVDGVLLVDAETQEIHEVGFPLASRPSVNPGRGRYLELYLAIAFLVAVLAVLALR